MSTNFIKVANFMQKLAYDAEHIIRRHKAGATHATDKASKKAGHDIVTDIDLMIEKHCIEKIKRAYPLGRIARHILHLGIPENSKSGKSRLCLLLFRLRIQGKMFRIIRL